MTLRTPIFAALILSAPFVLAQMPKSAKLFDTNCVNCHANVPGGAGPQAGALRRLRLLACLLPSAFAHQGGARLLSGSKHIEAHWMWFIFITARLLIFLSFQPRLAATLLRSCSVVNSLIRRAGLSPALCPASLAQRLICLDSPLTIDD